MLNASYINMLRRKPKSREFNIRRLEQRINGKWKRLFNFYCDLCGRSRTADERRFLQPDEKRRGDDDDQSEECVCLFIYFFYLRSRTYALVRFPLKVKYKDVVQAESITAGER